MKPQHERFCQLMAGGRHTQTSAMVESGYTPKTSRAGANKLLAKDNIKARIAELQERHTKASDVDANWIRRELVKLHEKSSQGVPVLDKEGNETGEWKYDSSGANKALDTLNRMGGHYEKDNKQKQSEITLKMEF